MVSIGLPVYNGENFISEAIQTALDQTFGDFELLISDNASTDGTEAICRKFASADPRIRYVRRTTNIGAGPNFNSLPPLARGKYFKWLAHDDVMAPTFVERCVDVLESDPAAVLACPRVRFIDEQGREIEEYVTPFRTDSGDATLRFSEMLKGHPCYEVFGLIRGDALSRTRLIGNFRHGDGVLLSHLALMGRFAEIPEYLFHSWRHRMQSMHVFGIVGGKSGPDNEGYAAWFDPRNRPGASRSYNRMLAEYVRMVRLSPLPPGQRAACYRMLIRWARSLWRVLAGEWKRVLLHYTGCRLSWASAEKAANDAEQNRISETR